MKKIYLILLMIYTLHYSIAADYMFEDYLELKGVKEVTDQAILVAPNDDLYFTYITNKTLIYMKKRENENMFTDFIPDYFYHKFDEITHIESLRFSNDRDFIFFTAVEDGELSLNIMSFDDDNNLIFREDLRYNFEIGDNISFLKISNVENDNAQILYNNNGSISYINFYNDFVNQYFDEVIVLDIKGSIESFFSDYSDENNFIISLVNTYNKEIWMLSRVDYEVKYNKISDIYFDKVENCLKDTEALYKFFIGDIVKLYKPDFKQMELIEVYPLLDTPELDFGIDYNIIDKPLEIYYTLFENLIKISTLPIFFDLISNQLFYSDTTPYTYYGYINYSVDGIFYITSVNKS